MEHILDETPLLDEICGKYQYLNFLKIRQELITETDRKIAKKKRQYTTFMLLMTTLVPMVAIWLVIIPLSKVNFMVSFVSFIGTTLALISVFFFLVIMGFFLKFVSYNTKNGSINKQGIPDYSQSFYAKLIGLPKRWDNRLETNPELQSLLEEKASIDYLLRSNEEVAAMFNHGEIHRDYATIYALTWLYIYLTTGRAESAKEAINLFESEEQQALGQGIKGRNHRKWQEIQRRMKDAEV